MDFMEIRIQPSEAVEAVHPLEAEPPNYYNI
jgi:hypothetical protein